MPWERPKKKQKKKEKEKRKAGAQRREYLRMSNSEFLDDHFNLLFWILHATFLTKENKTAADLWCFLLFAQHLSVEVCLRNILGRTYVNLSCITAEIILDALSFHCSYGRLFPVESWLVWDAEPGWLWTSRNDGSMIDLQKLISLGTRELSKICFRRLKIFKIHKMKDKNHQCLSLVASSDPHQRGLNFLEDIPNQFIISLHWLALNKTTYLLY